MAAVSKDKEITRKNPNLEKVKVTFPKIRGSKNNDIVILVNGKAWQIQRGVEVEVPRYVLKVYDLSERNKDDAERYIISQTAKV